MLQEWIVLGLAIATIQRILKQHISSAQLRLNRTFNTQNAFLCMGDHDSSGFGTIVPAGEGGQRDQPGETGNVEPPSAPTTISPSIYFIAARPVENGTKVRMEEIYKYCGTPYQHPDNLHGSGEGALS